RSTKVEDFANHLFPALMDDADDDVWDLVLEDVIRFGRGYDELLYVPRFRASGAPGYPKRERGEPATRLLARQRAWALHAKLPVVWRHLPARTVFTWRDERGLAEA